MSALLAYLDKKPIFYKKMSYFGFYSLYHQLGIDTSAMCVVQILGTNGKGTTGRYLANLLAMSGYDVFHFTSPHLLEINERFYYAGHDEYIYSHTSKDISNEYFACSNLSMHTLDMYHTKLQKLLRGRGEMLSYFEYLTLLFVYISSELSTAKTVMILEAGLGGEYDATSVIARDLCVYTRIRHDHTHILGDKLDDIITTKLKAMCDKNIALYHPRVKAKARRIASLRGYSVRFVRTKKRFLRQNFLLASKAYEMIISGKIKKSHALMLDAKKTPSSKASSSLEKSLQNLPARCSYNDGVLLDCGHNLDAAHNHALMIKKYFKSKPILLCNFFKDKDVEGILRYLKPYILGVCVLEYQSDRPLENVAKLCSKANIPSYSVSSEDIARYGISVVYDRARGVLLSEQISFVGISVFGSFVLIERFVKSIRQCSPSKA